MKKFKLIHEIIQGDRHDQPIFYFIPNEIISNKLYIFTHGYTASFAPILSWSSKLATNNIASCVFGLPGHYLHSFDDVQDSNELEHEALHLFINAKKQLNLKVQSKLGLNKKFSFVLGGHSLGAYLAASALATINDANHHELLTVGFGLSMTSNASHIFETPLFKPTMDFRSQLVSPGLNPSHFTKWLREKKQDLKLTQHNVHMITGEDDIVAGPSGVLNLKEKLEKQNCKVTTHFPKRLGHHLPELASGHIYSWHKKNNTID